MAEIYNSYDNTLLSGTSKADYITNFSDSDGGDAYGGDGYGENVTIKALAGNDTISNSSNNVTIIGGKGNDSIESYGKNILISYASGDGIDTVIGFDSDDTLHITKGSYETLKSGKNFIVKVGDGKIVLKNALADKKNSISIKNSAGDIVTYNDWTVWKGNIAGNIKSNVTLMGSTNNDNIGNGAESVLIKGRAGNDKISNSGEYVTITGGSGDDTISNGGSNVIIDGGKGADYISNEDFNFSNVSINGGSGNDTIYIEGGGDYTDISPSIKNMTINGGAGADLITLEYFEESDDHDISINGGSGNDTITNETYNSTITGGKGNDLISIEYARNNVIQYASGDGNDTIIGFDSNDILHITKGSYTAEVSGDDVIFKIGKGSITLKDAKGKEITITETKTFGAESSALFEENFAMADNLSEIVAEKSVGEVEFTKPEKISQENLITFSDK